MGGELIWATELLRKMAFDWKLELFDNLDNLTGRERNCSPQHKQEMLFSTVHSHEKLGLDILIFGWLNLKFVVNYN
jgi:hypothetical protein